MFASRAAAAAKRTRWQMAPLVDRLRRDRSGNVAMLFSLLLIPLVAMIGLAVDFGHVYKVTSHTQVALDAAALAAGRAAQLNSTNTVTQASAAATRLLQSGQAHGCRQLDAAVLPQQLQYAVHGHGHLVGEDAVPERPQLPGPQERLGHGTRGLLDQRLRLRHGHGDCDVRAVPERRLHRQRRRWQQRRDLPDARRNRLDVQPCTKIDAVKDAAKDLIDIVVWPDQSNYYSRVALAPFAEAVNVGNDAGAAGPRHRDDGELSGTQTFTTSAHDQHGEAADQAVDQVPQGKRQRHQHLADLVPSA